MAVPRALTRAQQVLAHTFTTTATILRKTPVEDTQGGTTDTYPAVATYPCSFSRYQITPLERETQIRVQAIVTWQFVFAVDADIQNTDRLQVGTRTFEVVSAASGSADISLKVLALEIT